VTQALEGLKILDLTRYAPGPYCTMILGDLGADVIKIEEVRPPDAGGSGPAKAPADITHPPELASPDSPFNPVNRNKRSICLNLKSKMAQDIFYRLATEADVLIEGFRPGVTKRLGIDYPTLKEINPGLIYCAVTGYGQDGPYHDLPGHDINYIASAGVVSAISLPGKAPVIPGNLIGDMAAGGMQAAIGILAALAARERTGNGQFVDISMTDGAISMASMYLSYYFETGSLPETQKRMSCGSMPYFNYYQTSDGKYIAIACMESRFFANLCRALDCEDLISYQTDSRKAGEIASTFKQRFLTKTSQEWFDILARADVPVSRVNTLDELADDPQVKHRGMILEVDASDRGKVRQAGISIKLSDTPGSVKNAGAKPGENTEEILKELGYSTEDIHQLRKENVIDTGVN
jgi:crotonobetainyl-CoA:carnitine CoA-transferase CaiB-like acyl-CoA transferase